MTMTSVAVGPGSLGASSAMLGPKRYLQQGITPNSTSPTPAKNHETLSKGKKSWSVRLGLSRHCSQTSDDTSGWDTISGSSGLSRQMLYAGEPWLYGTVRSRGFLTPPPPGAPILVVCSCPEFLSGTTRKLGNCRKCGGHRLAGIPLGGTCRIPGSSATARPSLAGILTSSTDDPYDLMRRSRLIEPRSRARSISPHRQSNQRDTRSQSVVSSSMERKKSNEWFHTEDRISHSTNNNDWFNDNVTKNSRTGRTTKVAKLTNEQDTNSLDLRKSILECNVNPYLLVKKQSKDEDDLSDDLSDNALEIDEIPFSNLFDPSKVKSIERLPNRNAVAAIGGQRIRVFNAPRELSDEEDTTSLPVTRIPIPKISPKRPPRRPKETKISIKSILKRGKSHGIRKNVLFNVNNVILAPEKPSDILTTIKRVNRNSVNSTQEELIIPTEQFQQPPRFITIPNIKEPQRSEKSPTISPYIFESKIIPELKTVQPVILKKPQVPARNKKSAEIPIKNETRKIQSEFVENRAPLISKDQTNEKNQIHEQKDLLENIQTEHMELLSKADEKNGRSCLTRSQSDRSTVKPVMSAGSVEYLDTMRLSFRRLAKDDFKIGSDDNDESSKNENKCSLIEKSNDLPSSEMERMNSIEHFRKMRPTSWSPPPDKPNYTNSKVNMIEAVKAENNICKITVTPMSSSPLVHRLQVGGTDPPKGLRRTSILINSDQNPETEVNAHDNKVTISVGGEDSVCNPTVISVNSASPPKIHSSMENRTLVILENYKSNIILESTREEIHKIDEFHDDATFNFNNQATTKMNQNDFINCFAMNEKRQRWSSLSKESLISKLLEDSLRKARENGEILDESSGEAILRILKQSLLKNKNNETSDVDYQSTNLFLEENPYEVIKEPIYEEIPDEPPPLPLSPPPTDDYIKDSIYFTDNYRESYYKKVNAGQYLGSYLSEEFFKKPVDTNNDTYLSKSPEEFFKTPTSSSSADGDLTKKFELLNFLMDNNERSVAVEEDQVEEDHDEEDDDDDTEGDLEALYQQKETSIGDLSSKSSQISNVSDSSEECNIILTNSTETSKTRTVDIERTDSGVGSESSQASSSRGVARRWRAGNISSSSGRGDGKLCEDCQQRLEPLITDSGVVYAPFICRKCSKKRAERKEIITEIVETEQKYGRDLRIILEEFHRPMLRAGLLTPDQLSAIFLNVEELLEHNLVLAEKLKNAVTHSQKSNDEDLITVDVGRIFLESERMLHAFESYCTRQGGASLLLQNLEKEKELLRIFLKVSQMENAVLRRMNLNSFLMVPVQRVTKYPLLLARLLKATPSLRTDVQEARKRLEQAQANIELHLEHMNAEAKDVTTTKLWRRISIIQNGRRSNGEQDMVNIKLRKMAVEVLEWAHEEARFVLEGRLLVAQPTDNNWRRGRTVKLAPITAMLVTNGKCQSNTEFLGPNDESLFSRQIGIKEATLLLVKEKIGRYSLLREPLYLDKCIVCCETDLEDYFEIQELASKETFIFKAEDGVTTKRWCRTLQAHAQSLGAWRRRRGALPNIMICGVARN